MIEQLKAWLATQGWKLVRSAVLTSITAAIVTFTDNPANVAWVPVLNAVSGWLRNKWPDKFKWLPV